MSERLRGLCEYALKLTRTPAAVKEADLDALRTLGLDDRAIVDANQVVAYYNYVNRVADGLGVELEPGWPEELRRHRSYPLARPPAAFPLLSEDTVPWLSVDQMREIDRLMVGELAVPLEKMMENAGRNLAFLVRRLLGGSAAGRRVLVLAGPGGNGGGGLVAARHLAAAGAEVEVRLAAPAERLAPVTRAQLESLVATGVRVGAASPPGSRHELVLDALLGYSQEGAPRGDAALLIAGSAGSRVVSLDVPSGLELASGRLHEPHVQAEATLTLAFPKDGLRSAEARTVIGRLFLADLSVPPLVLERLGLEPRSPFGADTIVELG